MPNKISKKNLKYATLICKIKLPILNNGIVICLALTTTEQDRYTNYKCTYVQYKH